MLKKRLRRALLVILLTTVVVVTSAGDYRPSALDAAVAPHRFSLVQWELSNFLDKWVHLLKYRLPWNSKPTREERISLVQEFFGLGQQMRQLERQLLFPEATAGRSLSQTESHGLRSDIQQVEERRRGMRAEAEEAIEAEISAVLVEEGFASRIGLIFPPVNTVLTTSPSVLILSPRDRIERLDAILLSPGLSNHQREQIEELVFREHGLSALVENTGGLATYPSVVSDSGGLRYVLEIVAHEWLHHWFFFRPLGWNFWSSPEMITLNETAATLGGQEIGDRAFTAMTGKEVSREPPRPPGPPRPPDPNAFNFGEEMQEIRWRTEELLAQGKVEEAEAYMEERRQFMVSHGYLIRKINQAYFAFHGAYATGPASISPIDGQLRELRARSESLGDFLRTVAQFGSYDEFLEAGETAAPAPAG